ncbi:MAG: 4-(cytidine 5'-diphospho)-2-C-methyl-D-erythritol kinase, partial [Deltaproteobacteria bacterium]|nr:4-(cytidine 5'-diphospho)-2-C-methyl-D-erythritol kinase [Deltaproteobacteria bacterium]
MKTLKLKSPGKVNLRLDVLGRRPDGYHDLRMLNSAISIYDDVEMEVIDRGIEVYCDDDPKVPSGEANIAYLASKEIMAYSNKNVGIRIRIKKRIPSAAGMGGGSSNAATVLMGLNQLLKIHLPKEKLMMISLRFGADIPFFLYGSPAIATGVGENLSKIKRLPKMPFVIVSPNVSVPTMSIYEKYRPNGGHALLEFPKEFSTKKAVAKFLNNDLESVTSKQYPIVSEIKALLIKYGALGAQMTGSGPTVFGIFSERDEAE